MRKLPIFWGKYKGDKTGLDYVSLVKDPAIGEKGLAFNTHKIEFKATKDKQIILAPAMIPDIPLYRNDPEMGEFYVVFTAEEIEKFAEHFNKQSKKYKVNFDHDGVVESAFIKSNWIIEDKNHDKAKHYGFDLPVGTWMMEVKVEDEAFWNKEIKEEGRFGFSVEGLFQLEYSGLEFNKNNKEIKKEKMTLNELKLALAELSPEEVAELQEAIAEVAPAEVVEEVVEAVVEVVEEQMAEGVAEVEASSDEEVIETVVNGTADVYTKEEADTKFNELMTAIAEVRAMVEAAPKEAEEAVAEADFSSEARFNVLKMYTQKFGG